MGPAVPTAILTTDRIMSESSYDLPDALPRFHQLLNLNDPPQLSLSGGPARGAGLAE